MVRDVGKLSYSEFTIYVAVYANASANTIHTYNKVIITIKYKPIWVA